MNARLAQLVSVFEAQVPTVIPMPPVMLGINVVPFDTRETAETFEYIPWCGKGETPDAAIDDWWSKRPTDKLEMLFWRVPPELDSDWDFATKTRSWQVFSRAAWKIAATETV